MKKILLLTATLILVMALISSGTWAYFSDTETTSDNVLVAGTLDLGLANTADTNPTGSTTGTWTVAMNWAPGESQNATLYLNNEGTIDMRSVNDPFSYIYTENTPTTVDDYTETTGTNNITAMITVQAATWNSTNI
ncbi:MAG: TasA family protein, partial [Dehalococcoidales bacterium]|nr:TasA family protein [Dehalococcoidales bacterium]